MSNDIRKQKVKLLLTKLNVPVHTGTRFRIDNILNIILPYSLPFKVGDTLTGKQVDELVRSKDYNISRIEAEKLLH